MKKYVGFFTFLFILGFSKAIDISCFQSFDIIKNPGSQTIKILSENTNIYPYQDTKLLNYKIYKTNTTKTIDYDIIGLSSNSQNANFIKSGSGFSFDQYDQSKYIIIKPKTKLLRNSFDINVYYDGGVLNYQVSKDGKNRQDIKDNITNYDIDYLKIYFVLDENKLENTNVSKLSFLAKDKSELVINTKSDNPLYIYTNYNCKDDNLAKEVNNLTKTDKFLIDNNTKTYEIEIKENPNYNTKLDIDKYKNDKDQDNVTNNVDNCPNIYNPDQKDSNADGIGDLCADDDNDGAIGYLDNCIYISNPDQKDINNNNIGDACEFDKDKDGVFDSIDNCINTPNPDQKDSDGDNIGDICDNCNLYNPDQRDTNKNGIGDVCEQAAQQAQTIKQTQDKDKDGVFDACDNCKNIQNYDQKDNDKNNIGDICEDIDKDGISGYLDNCPYIPNPDQKDDDNNGIGNLCEDQDEDHIINAIDNCPDIYNFDQRDIDHDGIGDACDSKDDRFIESNRRFFVGISILFIAIFGAIIRVMYQKIGKSDNE